MMWSFSIDAEGNYYVNSVPVSAGVGVSIYGFAFRVKNINV